MSRSVDKYSSEALQFCKIIVFPILRCVLIYSLSLGKTLGSPQGSL